MLYVDGWFNSNVIWKNKSEIVKQIKEVENKSECYDYMNEYFIKNVIFNTKNCVDTFWLIIAANFLTSIVKYEFKGRCLKEILLCVSGFEEEKYEEFRKYSDKNIDDVLNSPSKTKNSYLTVLKERVEEYMKLFDDEEEFYSFETIGYDEKKEEFLTNVLYKEVKVLPLETRFNIKELLHEYEFNDEELLKYESSFFNRICNISMKEGDSYIRLDTYGYFKRIKYDFYMFYSLQRFEVKLSSKESIIKCKQKVFRLKNEDSNKLFSEFLNFVKGAKPYKNMKIKKGVITGVSITVKWRGGLKYLFKKLPDPIETMKYLSDKVGIALDE